MYSETTILDRIYQYSTLSSHRYLKQSQIVGSVLTVIFTLTSETEAELSSDFHFGFGCELF